MDTRAERFRRAVETYFGGRPGRGARYPKDLQHEAVHLTQAGLLGGQSLSVMAHELGVGRVTLAGWLEQVGEVGEVEQSLRPVEIQRAEQEPARASALVLVAPSGWRLEGLRLEDVAPLLRALG
jgi:hypothetical protein